MKDSAALDQPRTDDPADHVARRRELEQARVKLLALAGALATVEMRFRVVELAEDLTPLLRVWDSRVQGPTETVACLLLPEGWRYTAYPTGPVLADADGITEPGDARSAAGDIAAHVTKLP